MNLTPDDVKDLREIIRFADRNQTERDEAFLRHLRGKEGRLSPAAYEAWTTRTGADLRAELRRWLPAYRIERTRAGYRVFRFIKRRRVYASRPVKAGMTRQEAEEYGSRLIRVV